MKFADRIPPPGSLWRAKFHAVLRHPTLADPASSGVFNLKPNDRLIVVSCRFDELFKRQADFSVLDAVSSTRAPDQIWQYSFQMSVVINSDPKSHQISWNTESIEKIQRAYDDMMPLTCLYELLSKWYKYFERLE